MSQNRKHFLKYNNLVRTTVIVHNLETDLLRSKEPLSIHLSQALVNVKGSIILKTIDVQNLLSRSLLLLSYTLMSKGHILKAKIQGLKGKGL